MIREGGVSIIVKRYVIRINIVSVVTSVSYYRTAHTVYHFIYGRDLAVYHQQSGIGSKAGEPVKGIPYGIYIFKVIKVIFLNI